MSIKIERTDIHGWEAAIRGARNPMNSWAKSDSAIQHGDDYWDINGGNEDFCHGIVVSGIAKGQLYDGCFIGPNDHDLLMRLCKGGTEESKWRRFVNVSLDITAPLYWWKEFETYKVGTVSNSCSTMHKIQAKEFTLDDFSHEHLFSMPDIVPDFENDEDIKTYKEKINGALNLMREGKDHIWPEPVDSAAEREVKWHLDHGAYESFIDCDINGDMSEWAEAKYAADLLKETIYVLNEYRQSYLKTKDKRYWWQMIQLLPSSYNQRRTIQLNYEVLAKQYKERKNHKLDEWREYCEWIKSLPYSEFITLEET